MGDISKKLFESLDNLLEYLNDNATSKHTYFECLKEAKKALKEYREQEKNPKTKLVELDKDKLKNFLINDYGYYSDLARDLSEDICKTFGTKRISVEDIQKTINNNAVGCADDNARIVKGCSNCMAKSVYKLIYGDEK